MISKAHAQGSEARGNVKGFTLLPSMPSGSTSNLGKCLECRLRGITVEINLQLID